DLMEKDLTDRDVVVGLSASGRTPYVVGALTYAKKVGAATIAIDCSPNSPIGACADIDLCAVIGPEVVTGSTRMKAGTAQKMIANMLSTGAMIRLGKVYGNLMVDVKSSNKKLEERARRIVMTATGCSRKEAIDALADSKGHAKTAIVMVLLGVSAAEAEAKLTAAKGYVTAVIGEASHGLR
ncbi:MAG: N-acetylmuramic acid 6-phosphate etherase, partial [Megasphaera sp.]|nr:N-acetylmuramic acid 6-phosphate etherase [Megasphaera sp.]